MELFCVLRALFVLPYFLSYVFYSSIPRDSCNLGNDTASNKTHRASRPNRSPRRRPKRKLPRPRESLSIISSNANGARNPLLANPNALTLSNADFAPSRFFNFARFVVVLFEVFPVRPKPFEVVEKPRFVVEDMHDNVAVINYRPTPVAHALRTRGDKP